MPQYVAFLRAVNVAGRFVKMAELRDALVETGFTGVQTHIQSGNVLVTTPVRSVAKVESALRQRLSTWAGFDIPVIVRTPAQVSGFVAEVDGIPPLLGPDARRYAAFASGPIGEPARATLDGWEATGERCRVLGADVLAELSIAFHRTTLTNARIEKITGLTTTWRDVNVVRAIAAKWGPS